MDRRAGRKGGVGGGEKDLDVAEADGSIVLRCIVRSVRI